MSSGARTHGFLRLTITGNLPALLLNLIAKKMIIFRKELSRVDINELDKVLAGRFPSTQYFKRATRYTDNAGNTLVVSYDRDFHRSSIEAVDVADHKK